MLIPVSAGAQLLCPVCAGRTCRCGTVRCSDGAGRSVGVVAAVGAGHSCFRDWCVTSAGLDVRDVGAQRRSPVSGSASMVQGLAGGSRVGHWSRVLAVRCRPVVVVVDVGVRCDSRTDCRSCRVRVVADRFFVGVAAQHPSGLRRGSVSKDRETHSCRVGGCVRGCHVDGSRSAGCGALGLGAVGGWCRGCVGCFVDGQLQRSEHGVGYGRRSMAGTPTPATSAMAVDRGTPTPATVRVAHPPPCPTPIQRPGRFPRRPLWYPSRSQGGQ